MKRREFLSTTLVVAAGLAACSPHVRPAGLVEVLLDEPIGNIAPEELQGHFTENISERWFYNGIWVGENSKDSQCGRHPQVAEEVDLMRQMRAPVIRWPGGCFADSYNWRDGVGPRAQQPVAYQLLG